MGRKDNEVVKKDSSVGRKENQVGRKDEARKEVEVGKKEVKKDSLVGLLANEGKESRIVHNNWIINNQVLKETGLNNQKQPSSKSVIMVKPNHALLPTDQQPSRTSVRKAGSERKPQKQQPNKKFFGEDKPPVVQKGRCSSVKQQRKEGLGSSVVMKNSSLTGKGKWKM